MANGKHRPCNIPDLNLVDDRRFGKLAQLTAMSRMSQITGVTEAAATALQRMAMGDSDTEEESDDNSIDGTRAMSQASARSEGGATKEGPQPPTPRRSSSAGDLANDSFDLSRLGMPTPLRKTFRDADASAPRRHSSDEIPNVSGKHSSTHTPIALVG